MKDFNICETATATLIWTRAIAQIAVSPWCARPTVEFRFGGLVAFAVASWGIWYQVFGGLSKPAPSFSQPFSMRDRQSALVGKAFPQTLSSIKSFAGTVARPSQASG